MSTIVDDHPESEGYLELLAVGDRRGALRLVRELERGGADTAALLELVASAQAEVGRRWQQAEWSVAQEHAATSVSDAVVSYLLDTLPDVAERGTVAVVCADGEWHVLPARMFALALERGGWRVHFVGGSVPPEHLHVALPQMQVDAVAVSCTMSLRLPGAARTVAAAHTVGLPTLVGGAGFGSDGRRAAAIGADARARSADEADAILSRWQEEPPASLAHGVDAASARALARDRERVVAESYAALEEAYPQMADYGDLQLRRTREDLAYHVDYVVASLHTADPEVYREMLRWLTRILQARGLPAETLPTTLHVLRTVLGMLGHEEAASVVATAGEQAGVTGAGG